MELTPVQWTYPLLERVTFGTAAREAIVAEVERHSNARVFIVTSGSLANTGWLAEIAAALGARCVGRFDRVRAHVPLDDIIAAAAAARNARADVLLAVGGGSAMDAAKVVSLCLRHDIVDPAGLAPFRGFARCPDPSLRPQDADRWVRVIAVPTTLSGAEFTWFGGGMDVVRQAKDPYADAMCIPRAIILDPAATQTAPLSLFLSTGIKALDHAAERLASLRSEPFTEARCRQALGILPDALRAVKADPSDLAARGAAQQGMALGMATPTAGIGVGASHALGHALGGIANVPHGLSACVILPHVMRWNRPANPHRQAAIADAMGAPGGDPGDLIAALVADLELPSRLRDIGVERDHLGPVAEKTTADFALRGNPRQPDGPEEIFALLEQAW